MMRIPPCLDNRFTYGGEVSLTHKPSFSPEEHYFSASVTHFCSRLSEAQGIMRQEGLGKLKNFTSPGLEPATTQIKTTKGLSLRSHDNPA
jgi:hypothetical protein